jgi:hypothetical protein
LSMWSWRCLCASVKMCGMMNKGEFISATQEAFAIVTPANRCGCTD